MGEAEALTLARRAARSVWVVAAACAGFIGLGHFLRQFNIVLNPLAWSAAEIIAALLCFTIAANVLVRDHGTGNRVSLLLGLTFGITGIIHLGAIFEFYHAFSITADQLRIPLSWMMGQTLLGLLFLAAYAINKHLPWPRGPKKNILAVLSTILATLCLITIVLLIFPGEPTIRPHSAVPRVWDLLPAAVFLAAAFVLNRRTDGQRLAFDAVLVWVAGLNAAGHLIASQSAYLLDAPAGGAVLLNTLSYLTLLVATLVDNMQIFRQVRILAISDSLTGLANYRRLVDVLQSELERSGRTNRSFSVLLMDLDGLKRINDRYGHLSGSQALCRVASILRLNCRSIDTAARYGGDEFALVLPETKEFAAQQVAERIRHCLTAEQEAPRLSLSIGISTFPQCGNTVQDLLEHADRALYEMKTESKARKSQNHGR
ncbi:MAG: GGDEF domain-containing protein [Acidobacteriia bacterium]|nr:GGDEF domain-containing protein [Terriglobia bacterium]